MNEHSEADYPSRVRGFLSLNTNTPIEQLSDSVSIYHELGIDGDDAEELLINFKKEFNVDMAQLSFIDHFNWELSFLGLLDPRFWLYLLDPDFRRELVRPCNSNGQLVKIPIFIPDLVAAASDGGQSF